LTGECWGDFEDLSNALANKGKYENDSRFETNGIHKRRTIAIKYLGSVGSLMRPRSTSANKSSKNVDAFSVSRSGVNNDPPTLRRTNGSDGSCRESSATFCEEQQREKFQNIYMKCESGKI